MAFIEIVALGLVLLVIVLVAGIAMGAFPGKGAAINRPPSILLIRLTGYKDGHDEMHLCINDQLIRRISDQGLRPADYLTQADELEKLAGRMAAALGVEVWLRRADATDQPGAAVAES